MDIKIKGVRKRNRVLWEVRPLDRSEPILRFWRTDKYSITREIVKAAGLDVDRYGAETRQLTFYRTRKKT